MALAPESWLRDFNVALLASNLGVKQGVLSSYYVDT